MLLFLAAVVTIPLGLDLYLPVPEDNPLTLENIELGKRLFLDSRLSRDGSLSSAGCHDPARGFSDGRPVAIGIHGRQGKRNAPALINRAYGRRFFWDGRVATLEEQVLKPIQDPNEMDLTLPEAATRVALTPEKISRACQLCPLDSLWGLCIRPLHQRGPRRTFRRAAGRVTAFSRQGELRRLSRWPELYR
jgi:hypothetical protein